MRLATVNSLHSHLLEEMSGFECIVHPLTSLCMSKKDEVTSVCGMC